MSTGTNKNEAQPDIIALRVEIPAGATDQWLALSALAGAFGWRLGEIPSGEMGETSPASPMQPARPRPAHEVAPVPSETLHIYDETFVSTSEELFGSPVYGRLAAELMRQYRQTVEHGIGYNGVGSWMSYKNKNYVSGFYPDFDPSEELPIEELRRIAGEFWDSQHYPFEMVFSNQRSLNPNMRVVQLVPGAMTQGLLATHLNARGLAQHTLHGSLGKSFDVYNVAAGITDPATVESDELDLTTAFITRAELQAMIASAVSTPQRERTLTAPLREAIKFQQQTGQPSKWGEIIVEGEYDGPGNYNKIIDYELVVKGSLANLANAFQDKRSAYVADFWRQFAE